MSYEKKIIYSENEDINFPYILYIPEEMSENASLIVDIKTPSSMKGNVYDMINELVNQEISYNPAMLMKKLNYPVIIPVIPRPVGFYTSYLGSNIINNDFTCLHGNVPKEDEDKFKDIDMQVYNMIKEANQLLSLDSKAIINGYSAGSKFATGFSVLHPDIICCNISGATGGLSTLPTKNIGDINLPYPIGIDNINFDGENFMKIKHFFYMGDEDINNPALPLCELSGEKDVNGNPLPKRNPDGSIAYKYDEDGKLLPYFDCYNKEEINIIDKLYGQDNLKRFKINEMLYNELGVDCVHKIYKGNHRTLFQLNREELINDMIETIQLAKQNDLENKL